MKHMSENEFYGVKQELLSPDFIAGLVVGEGTFYWTKYRNKKIPVFALRMHIRDFDLLINIKCSLNLKETVYEYTNNGRHAAFLIVRSFESIKKVIEKIYPGLTGHKRIQFIQWFKGFKDEDLDRRYKTIYNIFKYKFPELYYEEQEVLM